jgi:hypothetical protein
MEGKEDLATQVENMVAELEEPEPSTDIIMEAEQLLCSIPDTLVDRIATLENYTEMPGFEADAADLGTPEEPKGPAVSLPSGPEEEEELPPLPEEGEEEEGEELPPLPEDKQKADQVHIEDMTVAQLSNELDRWKTDGHIFLKEDGFDDCNLQFSRYLKRCEELDAKDLREQFEGLRDTMVETGDDVIDDTAVVAEDPYAGADTGKATWIAPRAVVLQPRAAVSPVQPEKAVRPRAIRRWIARRARASRPRVPRSKTFRQAVKIREWISPVRASRSRAWGM